MNNTDIFKTIEKLLSNLNKNNILICIDGGQGSGKTTFIEELKNNLSGYEEYKILNIEIDDFVVDRAKRENLPVSFFKNANNISKLFDFSKFSKAITELSKSNNSVVLEKLYNRETGKRDKTKKFKSSDKNILIVGGPYLKALLPIPLFDLKIFFHVDRKIRFTNTLCRGLKCKSRSKKSQGVVFNKFENFFEHHYSDYISFFDVIINNNDWNNRFIVDKNNNTHG